MSSIPDMTPTSLVEAVAPRTGKIITNGLRVFERGENLLQNNILHFVTISRNRVTKLEFTRRKTEKGAWHLRVEGRNVYARESMVVWNKILRVTNKVYPKFRKCEIQECKIEI